MIRSFQSLGSTHFVNRRRRRAENIVCVHDTAVRKRTPVGKTGAMRRQSGAAFFTV
jgi:hypothetical protein